MSSSFAGGSSIAVLIAGLLLSSAPAAAQGAAETATYRNPRYGFTLTYPSTQSTSGDAGRLTAVWVSRDGNAASSPAPCQRRWHELQDYRVSPEAATLRHATRPSARTVRSVVTRDGVSSTARDLHLRGKLINTGPALSAADRRLYDRVVEQCRAATHRRGELRLGAVLSSGFWEAK